MKMPVVPYDDYVQPFYTRCGTVKGNTPDELSKAAFLAFIAEFPELPLNSSNVEYLKRCFEDHFQAELN
jgi:hypothetical protein